MRDTIRFLKGGEIVELANVGPTETVLDYLRLRRRETGTKEGCGEGDCGACTVALGRLIDGKLVYQPVNSCIQLLGMIDGAELVTVEDLSDDTRLHPVQAAMVEMHGSQCGFCTPGFIMTLFTLYHDAGAEKSRKTVTEWLAGNLCRCTGYRPIIDAALDSCFDAADDAFSWRAHETREQLRQLSDSSDVFIGDSDCFFSSPATLDGLAALYGQHPNATLVAGATDVGLWITKHLRDLPKMIWLGRIEGLDRVEDSPSGVLIGATATYAATEEAMTGISSNLGELWRRIGSKQVRASGTVGGNIANGSPIGDTPPALIALGTTLELHSAEGSRALPLEEFFIDYGKQDRRPGEFVTGLFVPRLSANQAFRCYKITKRFRSGHLIRHGSIPPDCGWRRRGYGCPDRLWRHGWNTETGNRCGSCLERSFAGRSVHLGRCHAGIAVRLHATDRYARKCRVPNGNGAGITRKGPHGGQRHRTGRTTCACQAGGRP